MREFFDYRLVDEDELMFVTTDAVTRYPEREVIRQLKEFMATEGERVQNSTTPRAAEMERLATEFAGFLVERLESNKPPPHQKSYALKT